MLRGGQWVLCAPSQPHAWQAEGLHCPEDTGPEAAVTSPHQSPVTSALGREKDTLEGQQGQTLLGGSRHCLERPRGDRDPWRGGGLRQQIPPCCREAAGPMGTPDPGHSSGVLGSQPIPEHTEHSAAMHCQGNQIPGAGSQQRLQSTHSLGSAWSFSSWEEPGLSILPCSLRTPTPGSQPKPSPPSSDDSQLHLVCFHPLVPAAPGWMGAAVGPN